MASQIFDSTLYWYEIDICLKIYNFNTAQGSVIIINTERYFSLIFVYFFRPNFPLIWFPSTYNVTA